MENVLDFLPSGVSQIEPPATPTATPSSPPIVLTAAEDRQLLRNGFQPVPLQGKRPLTPGWDEGSISAERLAQWRAEHPDHPGTGLRTGNEAGASSDTLFAVDFDIENEADLAVAEALADRILGSTPLRRVGRKGCMRFYRKLDGAQPKCVIALPDVGQIELFGRGQVVAFGIHPLTGEAYRWTNGESPLTMALDQLPAIGTGQVEAFRTRIAAAFGAPPALALERHVETKERPVSVAVLREMLSYIEPTMRGNFSQWVGIAKCLWNGDCGLVDGETVDWHSLTDDWCSGRCWRERTRDYAFEVATYPGDIDGLARLVGGSPRSTGPVTTIRTIEWLAKAGGYVPRPTVAQAASDSDPSELEIGSDVEVGRLLLVDLKRLHSSEIVQVDGALYRFSGRCWQPLAETDVWRQVQSYDGRRVGDKGRLKLSDVRIKSIIHQAQAIADCPDFFDQPATGVNCANGFVVVEPDGNFSLVPHSPEQRSRHALDIDFDATVDWTWEAPLLKRLFTGCFGDDADAEQKIDLLAEVFGAACLGLGTRIADPKAIVFHGAHAENGKSQVLDCIRGLLPAGAVTSIPPSQFADDPKVVRLIGVLLNGVDELGTAQAISSEAFKGIITGDPRTARDLYKSAQTFRPSALHVFATNTLPPFSGGMDRGVQRRLIVIPFDRTIPHSDRIPHLGQRIVSEEGTALLKFALIGAARLLARGHFSEPPSCRSALRDWISGADSVAAWLGERCEIADGERLPVPDGYDDFLTYAARQGIERNRLPASNNFAQRVYGQDSRIHKARAHAGPRMFENLRLLPADVLDADDG